LKNSQIKLLFFVLLLCFSCSKSDSITKVFNIEGSYTQLEVSDSFVVTVSDQATEITVTTSEDVMPKVVVEKVGDKLKIYLNSKTDADDLDLKVIIPYNPDLVSVKLMTGSEFHSEYGLNGETIKLDAYGIAKFCCDIDADEVEIDVSGSNIVIDGTLVATNLNLRMSNSDITLVGQVSKLKIDLSGYSNIIRKKVNNRYSLVCNQCEGVVSDHSEAYIFCDGSIKVNVFNQGVLYYMGNADTSGSSGLIYHMG
jgi:hypothetical protein